MLQSSIVFHRAENFRRFFDKFSCDTTAGCVKTKRNLHIHGNHMPLAVRAPTTHHRHIMIWISFEYLMNIFHRKIHTIEFAPFNNINSMSSGNKNISKARDVYFWNLGLGSRQVMDKKTIVTQMTMVKMPSSK